MPKAMLIAHYGEDYLSYRIQFLKFLQEKGWECSAIVPIDEDWSAVQKAPFKAYGYTYQRNWRSLLSIPRTFFQFIRLFRKERPDHLFTFKFFPNFLGLLTAKIAGVPRITATVAGLGFLERRNESRLIWMVFRCYCWMLNKASFVIVQNQEDKEVLSPYLKSPELLITHGSGVNDDRFKALDASKLQTKKDFGLGDDIRYFLFCTRIVKDKGLFELIQAFIQVAEELPADMHLVIAGWFDEAGLEQEARQLIAGQDRIHVLGYQKNIVPLVYWSECMVLPSYYPEGVPRTLTEALALSKPIITTDSKGCRETCVDGENGYVVKARSVESIQDALLTFSQLSTEDLKAMQVASRKLFLRKFEQSRVYQQISEHIPLDYKP